MDRAVENYQSHERLLKVMRAKRKEEYKRQIDQQVAAKEKQQFIE